MVIVHGNTNLVENYTIIKMYDSPSETSLAFAAVRACLEKKLCLLHANQYHLIKFTMLKNLFLVNLIGLL